MLYSFKKKFFVVVFLAKHNEMITVLVCGGGVSVGWSVNNFIYKLSVERISCVGFLWPPQ